MSSPKLPASYHRLEVMTMRNLNDEPTPINREFTSEELEFLAGQLNIQAHEFGDEFGWDSRGYKVLRRLESYLEDHAK